MPVKYFLNCYRALSDGKSAVIHLENLLKEERFLISDWKVIWVGACAILRTSITLFQIDSRSCLDKALRQEIAREWKLISDDKRGHAIFWEFLRKERDNIIHEYEWGAYEMWMNAEGELSQPKFSLLDIRPADARSVLRMRGGFYSGQDSLELLKDSAAWVEERIYSAIRRAGYSPEEHRNVATFQKRPSLADASLLGSAASDAEEVRATASDEGHS
ncbi:hypothetical protein [Ciceribacter thiooxidans]|uniref:Uncharacterized protein n=1 Tax=Ciceribacter thiooxidans TaxID=1969821 RepID=A0ABV7HVK9_9HYPH|nr:hypothetical protein [Ciceribacter thiooxidans]